MQKRLIISQFEWVKWILLTILFYLASLPNVSLAETTPSANFSLQTSQPVTSIKPTTPLAKARSPQQHVVPPPAPRILNKPSNTATQPLKRAGCTSDDHGNYFDNATVTASNSTVSGVIDCNVDYIDYTDSDLFKITLANAGTLKATFPSNIGFYLYKNTSDITNPKFYFSDNATLNLNAGTYYLAFTHSSINAIGQTVPYQITFECQGCDAASTDTTNTVSYTDYFTLKIDKPLAVDASVDYQTRDGTAQAGTDYIATSGTATIPAGQTSVNIGVDILTSSNANKTFSLVLTNPRGAEFPVGLSEIAVEHTIVGSGSADNTPPEIFIFGDNPATVSLGSSYTDVGAVATDDLNTEFQVNTTGSVDTSTVGTYTITYTASDSSGNIAKATRSVLVSNVVISGVLGAEGGVLTDEWEEVILTVPEGAVNGQSTFQVLRTVNDDGKYTYSTTSTLPLEKLLKLKLPDVRVRDEAGIPSRNRKRIPNFSRVEARRLEEGKWKLWKEWDAHFIEVHQRGHANPVNRVKNTLPTGEELFAHDNITNHTMDAAKLYSLCGSENNYNCSNKDPVLFVHGFAARKATDFGGASHGGGSETWGQFPELIEAEGYAVFEFTWRTAARFKDVAANLADAIEKIQTVSGKKVHIIAHSFGGLLARTYLQNYAINRPYKNNVQSLITLGTPHSGIFDEDGTYHGVAFEKGQDSVSFEGCLQSSCNQAGEQTESIWSVPSFIPNSCNAGIMSIQQCEKDLEAARKLDISSKLGVNKDPGELPALLSKNSGIHTIPVNIKVLIGLTINRRNNDTPEFYQPFPDKYESGDALIAYAGQRFFPFLGNSATSDLSIYTTNDVSVTEKILGIPHGAVPNGDVLITDAYHQDFEKIRFKGYRHTNGHLALGSFGVTTRGDVGIAYVASSSNLSNSNIRTPHEALIEVKDWLTANPTTLKEPPIITLNLQVVDASSNQPIKGASIDLGVGKSSMAGGVTDANGNLSLQVPFQALSPYTTFASANGYHAEFFDTGYISGLTVGASSVEFGRIELQPNEIAKGSLGGTVLDAITGQPLSSVDIKVTRNGLDRNVTTDDNGIYSISNLVRGTYKVILNKNGYRETTSYFDVQPNVTNAGNASLRPILTEGTMSIRLSWDKDPRDLDSHLIKYDSSGSRKYSLYYGNKNDATSGDNLDRDDTSSYGPETVTIQSVDATSRYVFVVHHFTGSGSITLTSNAKVIIDYGNTTPISLSAPTSEEGGYWKVFEIINGAIIPCQENCILNNSSTAFARLRNDGLERKIPKWLQDINKDIAIRKLK